MDLKLTPNLPLASRSTNLGSSGRAQNISIFKLNQKKDIENAKVSVNDRKGLGNMPTTSVAHMSTNSPKATTSVTHIGEKNVVETESEADKDNRYYANVQRIMKEKRAKEKVEAEKKALAKQNQSSYSVLHIGTGHSFLPRGGPFTYGKRGLMRQLYRMRKLDPVNFKNLSDKDFKYFSDLVSKHAKAVGAGMGFDRFARRSMRMKIERDRHAGRINKEDAKDFRHFIHHLPKPRLKF